MSNITPFLKWAGGKRWLVQQHPELFPKTFKRYFEPFLGSGAVLFFLSPSKGVISDCNGPLKGESDDGFLLTNAGVESFVRVYSDIVDHVVATDKINPKSSPSKELLEAVAYYLDPLHDYLANLRLEEKIELKKSYGTGGRSKYWRRLQLAIRQGRPDFNPKGLDEHVKLEEKTYNDEAISMIRDLELFMKDDFREILKDKFAGRWFKEGTPPKVYTDAIVLAANHNRDVQTPSEEKTEWDCLHIIDYRKIAIYGKNWSELFENKYTKPGEEKIRGGKEEKTKWMEKLNKIRNENFHSYSVTEPEFEFLSDLHEWLIQQKIENNL
jgi:DNA sulfur modification protein DndB